MTHSPNAAQWWKVLAGGAALLIGIVVATTSIGELDSWAWLSFVILLLVALGTIAAGLVLGVVHMAGRRPAR